MAIRLPCFEALNTRAKVRVQHRLCARRANQAADLLDGAAHEIVAPLQNSLGGKPSSVQCAQNTGSAAAV